MKKIFLLLLLSSCSKDYLVSIKTPYGEMKGILYDQTPLHKANFVKLAQTHYYDGVIFHRIIEGFMIQGGDPNTKNLQPNQRAGEGGPAYKIPAEFVPTLFHKKGAIAAARDNNPTKASSGSQFYIVQGKIWDKEGFAKEVTRAAQKPDSEQIKVYDTIGGTPHLDGNYTVFGQVISGLSVIDSIAKQPRDARDKPLKDIRMEVSVKKVSKKKIAKYGL